MSDTEITAKSTRASSEVIDGLLQHEPVTLIMDLLEAHGFDFIVGLRTPAGNTLTITSRGAREKKAANLRSHVREAMSKKGD